MQLQNPRTILISSGELKEKKSELSQLPQRKKEMDTKYKLLVQKIIEDIENDDLEHKIVIQLICAHFK